MSDLFSSAAGTKRSAKHMTQAQVLTVGNWLVENRELVRRLNLKETAKAIQEALGDQLSSHQVSRLCGSLGVDYRQPEKRPDQSTVVERVRELRHWVIRLEGALMSAEHKIAQLQQALHGLSHGGGR
jgi:hypothetical protein